MMRSLSHRLLMHEGEEAALELWALLAGAAVAAGVDLGPGGARFGQRFDFGAVAGFGGFFPLANDLKIGDFFQAFEHRLLFGVVDFLAAGVVGAAFHVAGFQCPEVALEERDVLEEELLLEIFRAGGDDDALAGEDRGDEIGERLAGSRAGFDDQVAFIAKRGFDGFGHFELAGAEFIVGVPLGKESFAAEELANSEGFGGHLKVDFSRRDVKGSQ